MKIKVTTGSPAPPTFPYLVRLQGAPEMVVLMTGPGKDDWHTAGICLHGKQWPLGFYTSAWAPGVWEPFTDTITLSN